MIITVLTIIIIIIIIIIITIIHVGFVHDKFFMAQAKKAKKGRPQNPVPAFHLRDVHVVPLPELHIDGGPPDGFPMAVRSAPLNQL